MTQNELNREVAHATGETVSKINHLGFQLLNLERQGLDELDPEELTVDWDELQQGRNVCVVEQRQSLATS